MFLITSKFCSLEFVFRFSFEYTSSSYSSIYAFFLLICLFIQFYVHLSSFTSRTSAFTWDIEESLTCHLLHVCSLSVGFFFKYVRNRPKCWHSLNKRKESKRTWNRYSLQFLRNTLIRNIKIVATEKMRYNSLNFAIILTFDSISKEMQLVERNSIPGWPVYLFWSKINLVAIRYLTKINSLNDKLIDAMQSVGICYLAHSW